MMVQQQVNFGSLRTPISDCQWLFWLLIPIAFQLCFFLWLSCLFLRHLVKFCVVVNAVAAASTALLNVIRNNYSVSALVVALAPSILVIVVVVGVFTGFFIFTFPVVFVILVVFVSFFYHNGRVVEDGGGSGYNNFVGESCQEVLLKLL